ARILRKHMTPEEKHLWYDFLKRLPITVNKQKVIGNYIVDFLIASKRLVIEVDGAQHQKSDNEERDRQRDEALLHMGFRVLRYTNKDINTNFKVVCEDILSHLGLSAKDIQ
ncbi:MAG: DUF559 domain-containing protein, partial [Clostridia bacterium]|nr:DUF559 domain-containing protein [Clostridia bacterium]